MITPNTDFNFTQVKSDNPTTFTWKNEMVAEAIEMTTQPPVEKSLTSATTKHEGEIYETTGRLDDLLLKAVDETVKQVFKEAGAKVIYDCLKNKYHLKLEEIAGKTEDFSAGLEMLLSSAASVIERLVLKSLYSKLGLRFEEKVGYRFSDYIKELRERNVDVEE